MFFIESKYFWALNKMSRCSTQLFISFIRTYIVQTVLILPSKWHYDALLSIYDIKIECHKKLLSFLLQKLWKPYTVHFDLYKIYMYFILIEYFKSLCFVFCKSVFINHRPSTDNLKWRQKNVSVICINNTKVVTVSPVGICVTYLLVG